MCAGQVTDSQFYMWRTLFAVAHADHVVTDEEVRFMAETLEDIPFSDEQYAILKQDTVDAQNIEEMFKGITDVKDQAVFFKYAKTLCHIDGDYGEEEQAVMLRLQKLHMHSTVVDDLLNTKIDLEFADDYKQQPEERPPAEERMKGILVSLKEWFS